mgnify:FL=1
MFNDDYEILTIDDVMDYLNTGRNSVYKLLISGKLKGFRIGRVWKISKKSLDKYIDECVER